MCRPKSPDERGISSSSSPTDGDHTDNDSFVVSHVAAQLAQIGDKLELAYQKNRQREEVSLNIKAVCVIALFVALRLAI